MLEAVLLQVIKSKTKYIVVTGGVCSSIGKGVLAASLGVLLKNAGYSVAVMKCDPYLNVDPGTMSPLVHGEVFVTADGAETDLDLGHYERLIGVSVTRDSSVSSGQIYQEVLEGERQGNYLGICIQMIPHVVDVIKMHLMQFALKHNTDFVLVEIGGTIGDIEGEVFSEALRQFKHDVGSKRLMHIHLSYVPILSWTGEVKTKPTQHSVAALKHQGLIPDALFLRVDTAMSEKTLSKIPVLCGVEKSFIFQVLTMEPLYNLFIDLEQQGVLKALSQYFDLPDKHTDLSEWQNFIDRIKQSEKTVNIGLIAKYVGSNDPYISVVEAIKASAYANGHQVNLVVIEAEGLEQKEGAEWGKLKTLDGLVVPGGFDKRGIEGKVLAAKWARENKIPYFGLCLGMQILVIEAARNLAGLQGANSTEFDSQAPNPVICLMAEQLGVATKGATMRLGSYKCTLKKGSKAGQAYAADFVLERHRHRYEVNNTYRQKLEEKGVVFSGIYEEKDLVEIAEIGNHPFMLGTQFHPEFQSTPLKSHPLFKAFIKAAIDRKK